MGSGLNSETQPQMTQRDADENKKRERLNFLDLCSSASSAVQPLFSHLRIKDSFDEVER